MCICQHYVSRTVRRIPKSPVDSNNLNGSFPRSTIAVVPLHFNDSEDTSSDTLIIEHCFDSRDCHILPHQYRDCVLSLQNESLFRDDQSIRCALPMNMSFTAHNVLGRGTRAHIFSASFSGDESHRRYALKLATRADFCRHSREEYEVLTKLEALNHSLNIGYLRRNVPFLYFRDYPVENDCVCIIFVEQIPNALTLGQLMDSKDPYPAMTRRGDINTLIGFVSDCHRDILSVFDAVHSLNEPQYYQDTTFGNIMVDTASERCYLIDFGGLFSLSERNLLEKHATRHHRIYCLPQSCAPYGFYNLFTPTQRVETMHNRSMSRAEAVVELRRMAKMVNEYRLAFLFETYFMNCLSADISFRNKWRTLFRLTKNIQKRRSRANEEKLMNIWCQRYAEMTILKQALNNDNAVTNAERLWHVFQIFDIDMDLINVTECRRQHGFELNS